MAASVLPSLSINKSGEVVNGLAYILVFGGSFYQFLLWHGAMNAVGAKHESVAFLVRAFYAIYFKFGLQPQSSRDDVRLLRQTCLFFSNDLLFHQAEHHRMVKSAEHLAVATQLIDTAVAYMGDDCRLFIDKQYRAGCPHAFQLRVFLGGIQNGSVGFMDGFEHGIGGRFVGAGLRNAVDNFPNGYAGGRLASRAAAHTVAHGDQQAKSSVIIAK